MKYVQTLLSDILVKLSLTIILFFTAGYLLAKDSFSFSFNNTSFDIDSGIVGVVVGLFSFAFSVFVFARNESTAFNLKQSRQRNIAETICLSVMMQHRQLHYSLLHEVELKDAPNIVFRNFYWRAYRANTFVRPWDTDPSLITELPSEIKTNLATLSIHLSKLGNMIEELESMNFPHEVAVYKHISVTAAICAELSLKTILALKQLYPEICIEEYDEPRSLALYQKARHPDPQKEES